MAGNNGPDLIIGLTNEQADFIERNCDQNITFALSALMEVERPAAEKLVELMEQFKSVKKAIKEARDAK